MSLAVADLQRVATVIKSYGVDGEVLVNLSLDSLDLEKPVFLSFEGMPVPFFVENAAEKGARKSLIKFSGVDTLPYAEELVGRDIYVDPMDYESEDSREESFSLEGYTLYDQNNDRVGVISRIMDFSGNLCAEIDRSDLLVPLHDDLLIDIDDQKRSITLRISEGLI